MRLCLYEECEHYLKATKYRANATTSLNAGEDI